jgi:nicotinamide-nucleotide amidase
MRKMLSNGVLSRIEKLRGGGREFSFVKTISLFGLTESETARRIASLAEKFPGIKPGFRVRFPEIHIRLYAKGDNETEIRCRMNAAVDWILEKMGKYAFSIDGSAMEEVVGGLLGVKKASVAVAESCTGGLISHLLTNVPGSSDYFLFSGVTYSDEAKIKVLGVSPSTLERYGSVHEETAKEMAEGACRVSGATYAVSTTGIAGPGGGTNDKPVGMVCIGLCAPGLLKGSRFHFSFPQRWMNKKIFAMKALDLLRLELLD